MEATVGGLKGQPAHVNMYPVDGLPDVLPDHRVSDGHISVLDTIKQGRATITAHPVYFGEGGDETAIMHTIVP